MNITCALCEGSGFRVAGYGSGSHRDGQDDVVWKECAACSSTGIARCEVCMRVPAVKVDQGIPICAACDINEMDAND